MPFEDIAQIVGKSPAAETSKGWGLLAVLDPDVVLRRYEAAVARRSRCGRGALMFRHAGVSVTPVLVNSAA